MLQYFFEDARGADGTKIDNTYLFDGLDIMQAGEEYLSYMGQFPVINLSLKSGKQLDFHLAYDMLIRQIAYEYQRHSFILKDECLAEQKERYLEIMREKAERSSYSDALIFLSRCLEMYYGKKVIILIDEYDVPLENAFFEGFYKEMLGFIRSLFESALKTNGSLEFAVITGCLRISKESIFTGLNNLKIISIMNKQFDEYFGFTDAEVKRMCIFYHLMHKYDLIKEWYDGYTFGETNVYNPWSVVRFVEDLCEDEETKEEIEALIEGRTIEKPVHEDITYDKLYKTMDNLWNFMFFTGYFKKMNEWVDERTNQKFLELAIPNREVKYIFRTKILFWFREKIEGKDLSNLYIALINKDVSTFEEELNEVLMETISFNDAYENFYHGFVAGVLSGIKNCRVKSNREGGTGRSDLFIKPLTRRKAAFVIEFKIADKYEHLGKKAEEALRQIEDKCYVEELKNDGYQTVIKYGISFYKKDCIIKMEE